MFLFHFENWPWIKWEVDVSGSIIDNRSIVFQKPQQIVHVCGGSSWMILWFCHYICTVLYPNHLFIWVLFMTWELWFCYWSRIMLLIYFSMIIWRLTKMTKNGAYFIVKIYLLTRITLKIRHCWHYLLKQL